MEHLPPNLRRKLRDYRFAYWCLAIAETICLAACLIAFLEPPVALLLAILWLGWKLWRSPTDPLIAAKLESQHPEFHERLVSVVELTRHANGSPDLRHHAFAEIDRTVAGIEVGRLLSLRPVALLILAAVVLNIAVGVQRQRELGGHGTRRAAPPPAVSTNGAPETAPAKMTVTELVAALRSQPDAVLAKLPPHGRSLAAAETAARQAAAGVDAAGNLAQAAEALAEFARVARDIPELATLAAAATALANDMAATGRALATQAPAAFTNTTATGRTPPQLVETSLPAATDGPVWQPPSPPATAATERVPARYQPAVRGYFEKLAADSH